MGFPDRLNAFFKATGVKKNDLPAKIGVSRGMMFNYLAGRNEPSAAFFQNIKQAFPWVNIEWLITGEGEMCRPLADGEDEKQTGPKMDIVSEKILLMLQQMPEDKRREVLKYAEEREQLAKSEKTPAKRRRKANGD